MDDGFSPQLTSFSYADGSITNGRLSHHRAETSTMGVKPNQVLLSTDDSLYPNPCTKDSNSTSDVIASPKSQRSSRNVLNKFQTHWNQLGTFPKRSSHIQSLEISPKLLKKKTASVYENGHHSASGEPTRTVAIAGRSSKVRPSRGPSEYKTSEPL